MMMPSAIMECCNALPNAPLASAPTPKISGVALHFASPLSMSHPERKTFQSPDWGMQKISISGLSSTSASVPLMACKAPGLAH